MQDSLNLIKNYNRSTHLSRIKGKSNVTENLEFIYDPNWDTNPNAAPYEIVTQLMDCYYCLPERPDLAALFCWQAINNSYNQYLLADTSKDQLRDTSGIEQLCSHINNNASKYMPYLEPYYMKITDKTYKYVASYILKGYAIDNAKFSSKYVSSSYMSFKKRFNGLFQVMANSYGHAYYSLTSATLVGNRVSLNIRNTDKGRKIIHSFSLKLRELIESGATEIDLKVPTAKRETINFSDEQKVEFLLFCILYASRCNNFHGNVASRLNSIYANSDSFTMYTNIFLIEYMILAISLNEQNILSDNSLANLKTNENLILT